MNHCRYCEAGADPDSCPHNFVPSLAMQVAHAELAFRLTNYWESWLHRLPITDPADKR